MTSILRSPAISPEKRKLSSRYASAAADAVKPAEPIAVPAAAPQSPMPGATPNIDALLAQARESVLAQFKQEAETARELGRQRGLQEGRTAGAEEARREAEAELARIRSIAARLQGTLDSGIQGLEDVAVEIAFEAVCKVLGAAAASREGIRALVQEAAGRVAGAERVTLRLHPADLSALQAAGALDTRLASGAAVRWAEDKSIELGGCVVETDGGTLDARLETQLERLRQTLVAARAAARPGMP
jgi:flagellar biosynthesis/type III secretory pathway protein FliH